MAVEQNENMIDGLANDLPVPSTPTPTAFTRQRLPHFKRTIAALWEPLSEVLKKLSEVVDL